MPGRGIPDPVLTRRAKLNSESSTVNVGVEVQIHFLRTMSDDDSGCSVATNRQHGKKLI
jgi:hypothetical protein